MHSSAIDHNRITEWPHRWMNVDGIWRTIREHFGYGRQDIHCSHCWHSFEFFFPFQSSNLMQTRLQRQFKLWTWILLNKNHKLRVDFRWRYQYENNINDQIFSNDQLLLPWHWERCLIWRTTEMDNDKQIYWVFIDGISIRSSWRAFYTRTSE